MRSFAAVEAFLVVFLLLFSAPAVAQTEDPEAESAGPQTAEAGEENRLGTLADILASIAVIETEIEEREEEYRNAETEEQKSAISAQIEGHRTRVENLQKDFSVLATGIDPEIFVEPSVKDFDWEEELEAIFAPVIAELKEASAYPRELEGLRGQLASYERRLPLVEEAITNLEQLRESSDDPAVTVRLDELHELWIHQRDELATQFEAARQRLAEKERNQVGFTQAMGEILRIFFRERFVNFLFALLAFTAIFFVLRYLHRLVHRLLPAGGSHSRQFFVRLIDIAYYFFTVVVAVGALLVVLYLSADWVLLTLVVLVLIGVAWAARNAVPVFLEQAKLMLNLGAVREGERLIYDGIPWRVASLGLFSELENPLLRGGSLRLPLRDLVGLRSRLPHDEEPWFPSQLGDWVILGDETYGEVVEQTPEVVVVSTVRGSFRHYPAVDYIQQHPKNLSTNFFSINAIVSLDYRYRDIVNTEIAPAIQQALEEGFRRQPYGEHLVLVIVELKEMGASSLDLITIAKFRGGAASEYFESGWKLQQLALEACNEHGWEIPFPQLTLHQAS